MYQIKTRQVDLKFGRTNKIPEGKKKLIMGEKLMRKNIKCMRTYHTQTQKNKTKLKK